MQLLFLGVCCYLGCPERLCARLLLEEAACTDLQCTINATSVTQQITYCATFGGKSFDILEFTSLSPKSALKKGQCHSAV